MDLGVGHKIRKGKKLNVTEMSVLKSMCCVTRLDKIRNGCIRVSLGVT